MAHRVTPEPGPVSPPLQAYRGTELHTRGWGQEAALRMLMNCLDPQLTEQPRTLASHSSIARPVRDWSAYEGICQSLHGLGDRQTLLVQDGAPAGVFETSNEAPRVVIVNGNTRDRCSGAIASALFGRDAAQSWTYLGDQQALHAMLETFAAAGREHFGGQLAGTLIVSGGMGAAGGVQPLAAALAGAAFLGIDPDGEKITHRIRAGYCDYCVNSLDEALRILKNAVRQKQPVSVGLIGNCAEVLPELARRGVVPNILSDLTGVSDLMTGYIPAGLSPAEAETLRRRDPQEYLRRARDSLARHAHGMLALEKLGSLIFDFGNDFFGVVREQTGMREACRGTDSVSRLLFPFNRKRRAPLRWVALSGERQDLQRADDLLLELFSDDASLARWIRLAQKHLKLHGLPGRVARLDAQQCARYAERLSEFIAKGEIKGPIVIAGDLMLSGLRGTPDRPSVLEAALALTSGAAWLAFIPEEKAGTWRTSQAIVVDGTAAATKRLQKFVKDNSYGWGA